MFPRRAFPQYGNGDWSVFTPQQSTVTTNGWVTWTKPAGCQWVYIYMQGAGGGGRKVADSVTEGGGGGGAGGCSRLFIPALFLPDVLFIRPGSGGAGGVGAGAVSGAAGTASFISTRPETTTAFLVMTQSGGSGATSPTGGAAGTASTATSALFQNAGIWVSVAGQAGANGGSGAGAAGVSVTPFTSGILTTGGAGGGVGTGAGGNITAGGWLIQSIPGGASGSSGQRGLGADHVLTPASVFSGMQPQLLFTGGSGGGGGTNTGGNAGYGGGGGGGGGTAGGPGGTGGRGGDGFILIGAF